MLVKMLKPYYVKEDERFIRVVLAYQYFSIIIDEELYQFVPMESREIIIDRERERVHNVFDIFVFQRGKNMVYVSVTDLLQLPDFLARLNSIISPFIKDHEVVTESEETKNVINELEKNNLRRLIDQAIDEKDQMAFTNLTDTWNRIYS
ncbi:IDEAL domain-containing protein [Halobacillus salinarum]|uniref:IDEAL domain-containing protein n=1 Tax=Halobacillus salinarum TaxID=2932257 RepID=A0ABY4ENB0_9BACI|nr:IDEAL domain-containing protein [Halobacillus salinarum]UOQ45679.1 IDEAL domain-containing protein [Halobacillus salinarum]